MPINYRSLVAQVFIVTSFWAKLVKRYMHLLAYSTSIALIINSAQVPKHNSILMLVCLESPSIASTSAR